MHHATNSAHDWSASCAANRVTSDSTVADCEDYRHKLFMCMFVSGGLRACRLSIISEAACSPILHQINSGTDDEHIQVQERAALCGGRAGGASWRRWRLMRPAPRGRCSTS